MNKLKTQEEAKSMGLDRLTDWFRIDETFPHRKVSRKRVDQPQQLEPQQEKEMLGSAIASAIKTDKPWCLVRGSYGISLWTVASNCETDRIKTIGRIKSTPTKAKEEA